MTLPVDALRRLPTRAAGFARARARALRTALSIRRIHGPSRFELGPDDVVAVVLIRDGLYYLDRFLAHYRSLGVRHFVFVDNGSTDGTLQRLRREETGCVVLRARLPFLDYETLMRETAARRFAGGRWALFVDTDELLDFAGSDILGLPGLARYMRDNGHTAMVAQMLEMFPEGPISAHASRSFASVVDRYRHYDLGHVETYDYHRFPLAWSYFANLNRLSDDRVKLMVGGLRAKIFDERCGLSKHPLVFQGDGVSPCAHPHCASHVTITDVTAVLKHYKFANGSFDRDRSFVSVLGTYGEEARARTDRIVRQPDLSFHSEDAKAWRGVDALYDDAFLVRSPGYVAHVAARRAATA